MQGFKDRKIDILIYNWLTLNPNYSKYHKIYRKYHKRKNFNYKSVPKEIFYHWQELDPWFYSKKEFKRLIDLGIVSERFEFPNLVEYIFDGEECYGSWSDNIEENKFKY